LYFDFANILVFLVVGLGFILLNLVIAFLLRPKGVKTPGKLAIYECGEPTIGQAWIRFDIRFYTVALMFVVFDIEIALLFPWAVIFRDLVHSGQGWIAFLEAGTFITVLMAGLLYVWAKGDLEWTAPGLAAPDAPAHEAAVVAASSASNLSTVPGAVGLGGSGSPERERALTAAGGSHADRR
jgi:NADH-quinone oxidoreductase subunit A